MRTEAGIEIDAPIERVFARTTDDVTAWSRTCAEIEHLAGDQDGVGSRFRLVTEDRGRRMEFQGVTTRHEPPTASAVHLAGEAFDLDVLYTFEPLQGRTRVTQTSTIRGKGLFKVMFGLFGWLMKRSGCKAQEAELQGLKAYCEGG